LIFVNDNGGATDRDNTPFRGHKGSTWEGGMRVMFAMQWPAVLPKGKVYEPPVIALDIFPTAMAAAGVATTRGKPLDGMKLDGVNLIPFLTGKETGRPHQALFWKNGGKWAVRDGDLKLVAGNKETRTTKEQTSPELYDLASDVGEQKDLAGSRPADVERLRKMYEDWSRDFPRPLWGPQVEIEPAP
jgi:arylsulfatase A-like enzyme